MWRTWSWTGGRRSQPLSRPLRTWSKNCSCDNGRGVSADIYAGSPGAESWSSGVDGLLNTSGSNIGQVWGGRSSVSGSTVTVRNETYNGNLGANATTTYGFTGTGSAPNPSSVTCTSP